MSEILSPEGYAATGGMVCPCCGGTPLAKGPLTRRGMLYATHAQICIQCLATWAAVYELTGYEGLHTPQEEATPCP